MDSLTGRTLVDNILSHGQREAHYCPKVEDLPTFLDGLVQPGDLLITFGAGSITQVGPKFLELP